MKKSVLMLALVSMAVLTACEGTGSRSAYHRNHSEFNCVAGTVGGAVIGGLVGSTIGGGSGKTAATIAGAGGGGYVGHRIGCR